MKNILRKFTLFLVLSIASGFSVAFAEKAPDSLNAIIPQLEKWGMDPVIVEAVTAQNNQNQSLESIQKKDKVWQGTSEVDDFMKSLMNNAAAKKMLSFEQSQSYLVELFLMDNQGANVAMTNKTSDYWQGDEAKFIQSFNQGNGQVFIGDVEYDDSTSAFLVQISVPVIAQGKTIGAMTIGINLDEYENQ